MSGVQTITTTSNYIFLENAFYKARKGRFNNDPNRLKGVGLEGGSRSGKTWDSCVFICEYINTFKGKTILICRDTFANLRSTVYMTLKKVWQEFGMPTNVFNKTASDIHYNDNTIKFIGINDNIMRAHGLESDLLWINEAMGVSKDSADQLEQRNIDFFWYDYNPNAIDSWLFDLDLRGDYEIHKTSVLDNPYAPENAKLKILSYEPTERNKELGTADPYKWEVYGLGKRAVSEDVIFNNWELYTDEPTNIDWKLYGGDWGYSQDPTTLIQVKKTGNRLYLRELIFEKGLLNKDIANKMKANNWVDEVSVWDSSEPKSIDDLRINDIPADGAQKGDGSIIWGIQAIQSHKVYIHAESVNMINEFKKYTWAKRPNGEYKRNSKGKRMPVDKYNHSIDAVRYAISRYLQPYD